MTEFNLVPASELTPDSRESLRMEQEDILLIPYTKNVRELHIKGVPPGQLQYKEKLEKLRIMNIPDTEQTEELWHLEENTPETTRILTPDTPVGGRKRKLLLCIRRISSDDPNGKCLKAMLRDEATGDIALLTAISHYPLDGHRTVASSDPAWRISSAKMIAPSMFWKGVKNIANLIQ